MDRNSPPTYVEASTATALADVHAFVDYVYASEPTNCLGPEPLVTPTIIPRCFDAHFTFGAVCLYRNSIGKRLTTSTMS
jgi:hypothetical protein